MKDASESKLPVKPSEPVDTKKIKSDRPAKKKLKNRKLATYENPTVVVSESTNRRLLKKELKNTFLDNMVMQDKGKEIDLSRRTSRGFDFYQLNVLFNKSLTLADVKLAIYLHNIFLSHDGKVDFRGRVFVVRSTSSEIDLSRGYGDLGGIYIRDKYHSKDPVFYEESDFDWLFYAAKNLIGSESSTDLSKTLKRLHDYGYITVTDITPENQAIPIPGKTKKSGVKRRVRLKHVRLCKWMVLNKVFSHLKGM